jgi:hypothetical protein
MVLIYCKPLLPMLDDQQLMHCPICSWQTRTVHVSERGRHEQACIRTVLVLTTLQLLNNVKAGQVQTNDCLVGQNSLVGGPMLESLKVFYILLVPRVMTTIKQQTLRLLGMCWHCSRSCCCTCCGLFIQPGKRKHTTE